MATADFNSVIERRGTSSLKWDRYKDRDVIPLWVADMDFSAPLAVIEALHERVSHGIFGYSLAPEELTDTVLEMLERLYNWRVEREWIVWLPGLVTGINVTCRSVGKAGDSVVTSTPIYPPFLSAPGLSQRKLIKAPLMETSERWEIDFESFEQAVTPETSLFLHCNPHNPAGRVFSLEEQEKLAQICAKHEIVICADEIHNGLILDEKLTHIPTATLDSAIMDRTITLMAPSKTFNLPGFGCSFAIISNDQLRRRFIATSAGIVPHGNVLGYTAALAAYQHGESWRQELLSYLRENHDLVRREIESINGLAMKPVEATYLAWIDARDTGQKDPGAFFEAAGVGLVDGSHFGNPGWVRLNFACPRQTLQEGLDRIRNALA